MTITKLKHSFIDGPDSDDSTQYSHDEVQLTNKNAANMMVDQEYLDNLHCSHHHFEGILDNFKRNNQRSARDTNASLPKPRDFSEYLVYYFHQFLYYTTRTKIRPSGYWRYVIGVYKNLILAFYFNWVVIFTSPLSSIAYFLTYPVISGLLFAFEIGLKIFMDFLGGAHLVKRISQDYGNGFGIINWGAPQLLLSEKSANLILNTLSALGRKEKETATPTDHRHRTYDISIAQTMIILSSLVYERHDEKVTEAYQLLAEFNSKNKQGKTLEQIETEMKQLIWDSEKPIRKIARRYGLRFAGVTELKSLGGPFCGLFWSVDVNNPFIIVTFKGTTPTNYSEFLVDATLQRTDARPYLFGAAHEGFYDSLFPTNSDGDDSRDPYYAIQSAVRERAKQIQQASGSSRPIQVYVNGHSLGAALGALLFSRWLKCPEDIAPYCELRDAYCIGLPAIGDNDFASNFASYSNAPLSRTSTLFRQINKSDAICRIPPGYNSSTIGHYVPQTDFFNYSHIGQAVQITHPMLSPEPLRMYPSSYQSRLKIDIVVSDDHSVPLNRKALEEEKKQSMLPFHPDLSKYSWWIRPWIKRVVNPIPIIESFYPFFIRDHIPIHYFEGLERARIYYQKQQHVS